MDVQRDTRQNEAMYVSAPLLHAVENCRERAVEKGGAETDPTAC